MCACGLSVRASGRGRGTGETEVVIRVGDGPPAGKVGTPSPGAPQTQSTAQPLVPVAVCLFLLPGVHLRVALLPRSHPPRAESVPYKHRLLTQKQDGKV